MPTRPFQQAADLDAVDSLAEFRSRFHLPPGRIYLDGNSLGLLSRDSEDAIQRVIAEWRELGIGGWLEAKTPWFGMAEEAARLLAPIVGAQPDEVAVGSGTTVNLHQLLATLCQLEGGRLKILVDSLAFPSDRYAIVSHLRLRGLIPAEHLVQIGPTESLQLEEDDIIQSMREDVAFILLPSVVYTTGQFLDIPRLTEAAHQAGCLIGFDCSHSAGLIPHSLSDWGVDFAFWCGYKYLNGGPGSAAGLCLNQRHFGKGPGLAGWFSSHKQRQFDMAEELSPAPDAGALQIGTPPILAIAPLLGSLPLIHEAGLEEIRAKSLALTEFLIQHVDSDLAEFGFQIVTPRQPERRGGHVALLHEKAAGICAALKDHGVVPDFRPPGIVRLGPSPLYNTFRECAEAVARLRRIMEQRLYENYSDTRGLVA